jgi:phage tail sheath protein FI
LKLDSPDLSTLALFSLEDLIMVQVSYPGPYIVEFAPAPPIQPAATSVAAFVGFADPMAEEPAPIGVPLRITSFAQFQRRFGTRPVSGFYLWYAVRGFFENGGTDCFVVRASNGSPAVWSVPGSSGPVYSIQTKALRSSAGIIVTANRINRLTGTLRFFSPGQLAVSPPNLTATLSTSKDLFVTNGHLLQRGDKVQAPGGQTLATILRAVTANHPATNVSGIKISLDRPLPELTMAAPQIVLAPLRRGEFDVRLDHVDGAGVDVPLPTNSLVGGAILELAGGFYYIDRVATEHCNDTTINPPTQKITYRVSLRSPFESEIDRSAQPNATAVLHEASIEVNDGNSATDYRVAIDEVHPDYFVTGINRLSRIVTLQNPTPSDSPSTAIFQLINPAGAPAMSLVLQAAKTGQAENPNQFSVDGATILPAALDALRRIPEVNMVAIPDACGLKDATDKNIVMQAIIGHCETMAERFGVLDAHSADQEMFEQKQNVQSVEEQMGASRSTRGYAALYYPWIRTRPAGGGRVLATVPPSGHVCGLLARVDKSRGVHKAPGNETLNDAVAITQNMTDQEQGILNLQGINVIRTFTSGGRPIVFGARTTASDKNWQYVNVRRLFLFLEESIATALRSSIFEPNNTELWGKLKRVITAFLTKQWQDGALFGNKAEEAFYVKIDDELNPVNEQALGKLNIEIGVRPTYPAEFIVVRIGIWDGGMSVSEA